ncbi:hypothetical protein SCHPADRAFT_892064 [Schizopora paradoxa]|uniref:Uncharacterized protein n=1 Tax=Schizopora paradoxa TaxID=27342 RepID=A0A0H2RGW1_9AGAM|nr:hypothetical protein SCHPADRAFT_892064 [Schizopora paradoxa]
MQLSLAAALFASSLAAMALAGDVGNGAGSVDSLLGAVRDRGTSVRDIDPMRNERFYPQLDNATFVNPYFVPNEYPAQAQMMFLHSVLGNSESSLAESTRTSAVTSSAIDAQGTSVAEPAPSPTPSGTCSLKNKGRNRCDAYTCLQGTGSCYMGYDGNCKSYGLTGDDASVACLSCSCTKDR